MTIEDFPVPPGFHSNGQAAERQIDPSAERPYADIPMDELREAVVRFGPSWSQSDGEVALEQEFGYRLMADAGSKGRHMKTLIMNVLGADSADSVYGPAINRAFANAVNDGFIKGNHETGLFRAGNPYQDRDRSINAMLKAMRRTSDY